MRTHQGPARTRLDVALTVLALAGVVLAGVVPAAGCTRHPAGEGSGQGAGGAFPTDLPTQDAARLVATLSDEDLVGQVLMPYAYGTDATRVGAASQAANRKYAGVATPAEIITKYHLGGIILTARGGDDPTAATNSTSNITSPAQLRALTTGLQGAAETLPAKVPLLIATDQEYGTVTRIRTGTVQLPSALALGAARDGSLTEQAWRAAGTELAAMGINVDFAPDADVLGDKAGGVIGSRSFGSAAEAVSTQVAAAVRGVQSSGVAATLKHFPGHGHTTSDSHKDLPVLAQSRAQLDADDLPPFVAGVRAGAGLVMSGHLDVQAIDPGTPASFSAKVLIDLLRRQLGFRGVVVSDSLGMAPAKRWSPAEAAVLALLAGNDLLLMPPDPAAAQRGLLDALASGRLPRARLVEAATRVLALRYRLATGTQPEMSVLESPANRAAVAAATAAAVTVMRGGCGGGYLTGAARVTATARYQRQREWLATALREHGWAVTEDGGVEVRLTGYADGTEGLSPTAQVTVAMDTPYVLAGARSPTLLATYASTQPAMEALAAVLSGKAKAPGRSPVAVAGLPRSACVS